MLEPQGLIPRAAYEGNEGDDGVSKTKSDSSSIHIPVGSYRNPPVREPEITETYIRGQRACWCTWWQRFRAYIASRKENVFNVAKNVAIPAKKGPTCDVVFPRSQTPLLNLPYVEGLMTWESSPINHVSENSSLKEEQMYLDWRVDCCSLRGWYLTKKHPRKTQVKLKISTTKA